ncbi:Ig domain protein, group 1 domain protein [Shewanella sp. W3-18-1]|uniref:Ig-like domain-containing protein n=1 Tax=Shewanella sp. (strain W3-18-1) TaxID=351745 RepID=UPI00005FBD0E|nr:Ig-like domain-containing protein [Shewanella sp. W3-18-1]ABM26389.1 Ig domain protein, group 1 domain protein [Shewanella sp. W3-18-1]
MRLSKMLAVFSWVLLGALALSGCNGATDEDNGSTDATDGIYKLSIDFKTLSGSECGSLTSLQRFPKDTEFCAVAKLKKGSAAVSNQKVDFTTDLGVLTPSSKLTDNNGEAIIIVSNPDLLINAGTISATTIPKDSTTALTASRNFEFLSTGDNTSPTTPKLSASILSSSALVTRFKVDEAVKLQAILLDSESKGIEGAKVTFTAGSATLNPASALTNNQGIAQVTYTPSGSELGANALTVTVDYQGQSLQTSSLYEVLSKDAVNQEGTLKLGSFNGTVFTEGKLASTLTADAKGVYKISAGGSFGVSASLVLEANDGTITRVQTPASISFSSDCTTNNSATLDTPVTTLSGNASSTFQDTSCSGNSERNDQIIATTVAGNQTLTASLPFTLQRQTLASLSFESAEPTQIRIKGAGGTGSSESSLVSFKVTSANGQPAAQQEVSFTLDTVVGGLSFANGTANAQSLTNSQGIASVRVLSGTVPTPVRVVATAVDTDTKEVITSQSEQLTVNTGLPQQLGFSLATSNANPEAGNIDGEKVTVTARLSDSFGNPAPNDTTVNFTSEGGQIEPSCLTQNGVCSVTWTSSDPRPQDHRITVLAYALGHETFFDTNGNNQFDSADGSAIAKACLMNGVAVACSGNGLDVETFHSSGFSDLPTAFRDDNENFAYDSGERYFDNLASSTYKGADGKFNGPQCQGALCGTGQANKTYVRKAVVMIMSGSKAYFSLWQDDVKVYEDRQGQNILNNLDALTAIPAGKTAKFTVKFYDSADQIMPSSTTLNIGADKGELLSTTYTVPKTNNANAGMTDFFLKNTGTASSQVVLTVNTPSGVETLLKFNILLQ